MKRREFITLLGGAAAAWPLAARAQQGERMRRIGVLAGAAAEGDSDAQALQGVFRQALQQLGWTEGRNVRYEYRSRSGGHVDLARRNAAELVALDPDVIVVGGATNMEAVQRATRTIPIVFVGLTDPVGAGFVESLARPGGNTTGFTSFEYGLSAKWVELLKEIAPRVTRVGVLREQGSSVGIGLWAAMQGAAPSLGIELRPIGAREASDIERGVAAFARGPNGGLIVTVGGISITYRDLISTLAARHQLPAVYPFRYFVTSGGLMSYGPDLNDQNRRAAGYVDRILKGEKPADLPVQAPTKYELVINLKTAKALGLAVPPSAARPRRRGDRMMRRREFITLLGGAAAGWPLSVSAQQPVMPVVGFLRSTPAIGFSYIVDAFRQGLTDAGFVEGKNVTIEYRWADNQLDQLPELVADLVRKQVAALVGSGPAAAQASKAASNTTSVVFVVGSDPVRTGLVASLNRPGSNITGVVFTSVALAAKLLGMLHQLVPQASIIAALRDPNVPEFSVELRDLEEAAQAIGRKVLMVNAANEREFHAAFTTVVQAGASALLIGSSPFFLSQRRQLVALAGRHALPAIYNQREYAEAGGLISYGPSQTDAYRRAGLYVGRILKGEKAGDLPVELGTKYEMVINLATAKAFNVEIPPTLLALADEVIE